MTTDPSDLRTLAAEALDLKMDGFLGDSHTIGDLADAVLAAVLPAHRAMVLGAHAEKLRACAMNERWEAERHLPDSPDRITHIAAMKAYWWAVQLAETGPETTPASTLPGRSGLAAPASTPTPDGDARAPARWRVGRKVGRTVYRQAGPDPADSDVLVGVMDTPELAAFAVEAMNRAGGDTDAT